MSRATSQKLGWIWQTLKLLSILTTAFTAVQQAFSDRNAA